jgi:hypothetical protein
MNSATQQRDRVGRIAATDPQAALDLARRIDDPWFRCQALSMVAVRLRARPAQRRAIDAALAAANAAGDANRVVTVSSWAVKALALTGSNTRVSSEVSRLLGIISTENSPVRRADALRYLLGSVSGASSDIARRVAEQFAAACLAPLQSGRPNTKGQSLLEECLPGIARIDPKLGERLLRSLVPARSQRAVQRIEALKGVPLGQIFAWPHFGE